ncbi:hypothetical protein EMCRGX_G015864 [Ephydatia muelleri]
MQTMRSIISGGEPSALIQNEDLALNDEERRALLQKAVISSTIAIGAAEVLAKKPVLLFPGINYDFLDVWDSVTNLHAALDCFKDQVEHLNGMKWRIFTCGDFEFLSKMYGLSRAVVVRGHAAQRTLETMRADHQRYVSAGSIKRDAQKSYNCISPPIFDIPVSQVCPPGLHITLGIFTKMFNLLEAVCCNLDLELALHATDVDSSSFSEYSLELQNLSLKKPSKHRKIFSKWQHMWSWLVVQREIHELGTS